MPRDIHMRNHPLLLALAMFLAFNGAAQVQVSQEPRHHKVFENEWVRILDVHIPPHDTTLMHKHSTPSVFMVLSNTKTGSQVLVEPGKTSFANGNIWFESFKDTPRIHRVWNEDTVEFHVIDMELLHAPSAVHHYNGKIPFSAVLFDVDRVQAFRVMLPPGEMVTLPTLKEPFLIVGLSAPTPTALAASPPARPMVDGQPFTKKGDYRFVAASASGVTISNKAGSADAQFAVFVLY
jgi:hypothetical protein